MRAMPCTLRRGWPLLLVLLALGCGAGSPAATPGRAASSGAGAPASPGSDSPDAPDAIDVQDALARQARAIEELTHHLERLTRRLERLEGSGRAGADGGPDERGLEARLDRLAERTEQLGRELERGRAGGAAAGTVGAAQPPPRPAPPRPDPSAVYAVPVAGWPSRGPKSAPVTLVRSFEFDCRFSHKSRDTMDELLAHYGGDLRIVYRDFVVHPNTATIPARAACAAGRQGKYFQMHDLIWTRGYELRDLTQANMERLATELGLDMPRFRKDLAGSCADRITKGQAELARVGQSGTPAFWINGRYLSGARPVDQFKALIDEELALARSRIGKRGTTRANYYQRWVLGKGKKKLD